MKQTEEQFEELVEVLGFDPNENGVDLSVDQVVELADRLIKHVATLYERITKLEKENANLRWQVEPDTMGK